MDDLAGWLILVAVFLLGAAFVVLWLVQRKKWDWPKYSRSPDVHYEGFTARCFYNKQSASVMRSMMTNPLQIAQALAYSAYFVDDLAKAHRPSGGHNLPPLKKRLSKQVAVLVLDDKDYGTYTKKLHGPMWPRSNGTLTKISRKMGKESMPLVVCRAIHAKNMATKGVLLVHELVHQVIFDNRSRFTAYHGFDHYYDHGHNVSAWSLDAPARELVAMAVAKLQ